MFWKNLSQNYNLDHYGLHLNYEDFLWLELYTKSTCLPWRSGHLNVQNKRVKSSSCLNTGKACHNTTHDQKKNKRTIDYPSLQNSKIQC